MRPGIDALEQRTKQFTVDIIRLTIVLGQLPGLRELARQLASAAGSVGAYHRAMRRARSMREFAAKLQHVNEEIDETVFWLEVARSLHSDQMPAEFPHALSEATQLRSIFATARATTRRSY